MTEIPLTEDGRALARRRGPILAESSFTLVLTSPLRGALGNYDESMERETALVARAWNRAHASDD